MVAARGALWQIMSTTTPFCATRSRRPQEPRPYRLCKSNHHNVLLTGNSGYAVHSNASLFKYEKFRADVFCQKLCDIFLTETGKACATHHEQQQVLPCNPGTDRRAHWCSWNHNASPSAPHEHYPPSAGGAVRLCCFGDIKGQDHTDHVVCGSCVETKFPRE